MTKYLNRISITLALLVVWIFFSLIGWFEFNGSNQAYITFCLVSFLLVVDAVNRPIGLSYYLLVALLTLGFWLKLVVHLWLNYDFVEPIGYFRSVPEEWDSVLLVSSIGFLGVIFGKMIFSILFKQHSDVSLNNLKPIAPIWYGKYRVSIWIVVVLLISAIISINITFGIARLGLVSQVYLPWPLHGLMAWTLSFGMSFLLLTLLGWDRASGFSSIIGFSTLLFEGVVSSIASLSRATYLFHTLPVLFVLLRKAKKRKIFFAICTWFFGFLISMLVVMSYRYPDLSPKTILVKPEISAVKPEISAESSDDSNHNEFILTQKSNNYLKNLSRAVGRLIIDRWIGLEGVMAVVSYPEKNMNLLAVGLFERRVRGKVDIFTGEIARAGVTDEDLKDFSYASIPGGVALFYFSGSMLILFLGMSFLVIMMLCFERIALFFTANPYFYAVWAVTISQSVASLSLGFWQFSTYYALCFSFMAFIWLIQPRAAKEKIIFKIG